MARSNKYKVLVNNIVDLVGGKDNITFFTHCITRLRFNVKDKSLVKKDDIESIKGVVGTQWSGEQIQVIVGQNVNQVFKSICEKNDFKNQASIDYEGNDKKKKISIGAIVDGIAGCLTPLLPVIIGAGMIQVLVLILELTNILSPESSTYQILSFVGQAGFYFLPIFVGKTAAQKFHTNEGLGMLIGAMLIIPGFVNGVAEGINYNFIGIPIYGANYSSTILPVIMCVFIMAPIQRFFASKTPETMRSILEPVCTLLIMIPISFCIIGPIGAILGNYISDFILWLYKVSGFFAVGVMAALMPFLVITGMHVSFTPYILQMLATVGYEPIFCPAMILSNINQGFASLAVALKSKNKETKSIGFSCALTAIAGGVTEPSMYGINLKYKTPMIGSVIGSFCGAVYLGLTHVYLYTFAGSWGLFSFPAFIDKNSMNVINFFISVGIGAITTCIATFILYKEKEVDKKEPVTSTEETVESIN